MHCLSFAKETDNQNIGHELVTAEVGSGSCASSFTLHTTFQYVTDSTVQVC